MPPSRRRTRVNGEWLRENLPGVAQSMDRFIDKIRQESHGKVIGDFEIVRIPLDLYHARHATNREWLRSSQNGSSLASAPVILAGDSAIGSPYFQSISLGFDCATKLAGLLAQPGLPLRDMLDQYELYVYKQWLQLHIY